MPELPDIKLFVTRLSERIVGQKLEKLRFYNPFVLRSAGVPPADLEAKTVSNVSRLGKRIVIELEGEYFIVIHLMIAGRFQWVAPAPPLRKSMGKVLIASLRFESGQLDLTEMSTRKRASMRKPDTQAHAYQPQRV